MCGIAGIFGDASRDGALLAKMGDRLAHRGPDDHGVWADPEAGIGFSHRRLAIVDLSAAGHQPMHSSCGRFVLDFNGEIYNHAELRALLDARGGTPPGGWRGHSDTETLVETIALLGLRLTLDHCVGQFAFALWDRNQRMLSLVRDRFGEKPLYYGWAGRDFLFASELKAIRCHPRFGGEIDRQAVALFARRAYIPAPLSIYRRIFKLEPGCILEISAKAARLPLDRPPVREASGDGIRLSAYWSYRETVRRGLADPFEDEQQALDALERALAQAIVGQSIADVPIGAFLSGGIDSSTVVALYQKYSPIPVKTFTIGFNERAYNEADHARAVARELGTDHVEQIVTAEQAQAVIPRLPTLYDEPFADPSQIPTYLVSALARRDVTVALSGDGGDELFGGYNRYFMTARLWSAASKVPWLLRAGAGRVLGSVPGEMWDRAGAMLGKPRAPHFGAKARKALRAVGRARTLEQMHGAFLDDWAGHPSPVIGERSGQAGFAFDLDVADGTPDALRMMYCDAVSYLPDDVLCKVDRAAMGVSLETRVPFLDQRVAAVAARIPLSMKIRGSSGKLILKRLLEREAPRALIDRPKSGFGIPVGEWIRGPLREWAEQLLDPRRLADDGWFDSALVTARWRAHLAGTADSTSALWTVLMFQAWRESEIGRLAELA